MSDEDEFEGGAGLKAPFPYFGGKRMVAHEVWAALGSPRHYIEPFFGSGAVLLNRPGYNPATDTETVNDKDGHIANVWRALKADPDAVAEWADWPVNHADLSARRRVLCAEADGLCARLAADPDYYDAKVAAYWIWAASCWIGSGMTRMGSIPHMSNTGVGIHGFGQIPHVSNAGVGIHGLGKIPHVSDAGKGVLPRSEHIYSWFRELSARLRRVRVVCGDWTRVCGGDWQDKLGAVGVFFDPPYGATDRDKAVYHHDSTDIAAAVHAWAIPRGRRPTYRIVIAGYVEEGEALIAEGWRVYRWSAQGGYGYQGDGQGKLNRHREALFFSPHCIGQGELFA